MSYLHSFSSTRIWISTIVQKKANGAYSSGCGSSLLDAETVKGKSIWIWVHTDSSGKESVVITLLQYKAIQIRLRNAFSLILELEATNNHRFQLVSW